MITPDLWLQLLWRKLRFEAEAVTIQGQIGYLPALNGSIANPVAVRQYGVTTQTEFRAIDDKLDLQFGFGWASGDPYAYNQGTGNLGNAGALQPPNGLQSEYSQGPGQSSPISTFRFHPDYRVDLIFFRNILTRVEGAYYFRPSIDYDLLRHADGEKTRRRRGRRSGAARASSNRLPGMRAISASNSTPSFTINRRMARSTTIPARLAAFSR